MDDGYSIYSKIYDQFFSLEDYKIDIEFMERNIVNFNNILEIGVGSGRLLSYFKTKTPASYIGIDSSVDMIKNIPEDFLQDNFRFTSENFISVPEEKKFDLILFSYNTFNYLLSQGEAYSYLFKSEKLLNENGAILLDITIPDSKIYGNTVDFKLYKSKTKEKIVYELWKKEHYQPFDHIEIREMKYLISSKPQTEALRWKLERRIWTPEAIAELIKPLNLSIMKSEIYRSKFDNGYFLILMKNEEKLF